MKICTNCKAQNPDDAKFCWSCGNEFKQTSLKCPNCGRLIENLSQDIKFCPFCGSNLTDSGNMINGHEFVDLGLSVKWATCNVGAEKPSDYGNNYAWGEIATKKEYTEENCKTVGRNIDDISGRIKFDAVRKNWGSPWRLPTADEFRELILNCVWEWTQLNGHKGYKVTASNGNSIFLPAAGYYDASTLNKIGEQVNYWSSSPDEYEDEYFLFAISFSFDKDGEDVLNCVDEQYDDDDDYDDYGTACYPISRESGLSIRPVLD